MTKRSILTLAAAAAMGLATAGRAQAGTTLWHIAGNNQKTPAWKFFSQQSDSSSTSDDTTQSSKTTNIDMPSYDDSSSNWYAKKCYRDDCHKRQFCYEDPCRRHHSDWEGCRGSGKKDPGCGGKDPCNPTAVPLPAAAWPGLGTMLALGLAGGLRKWHGRLA